jgi:hypothetical protein
MSYLQNKFKSAKPRGRKKAEPERKPNFTEREQARVENFNKMAVEEFDKIAVKLERTDSPIAAERYLIQMYLFQQEPEIYPEYKNVMLEVYKNSRQDYENLHPFQVKFFNPKSISKGRWEELQEEFSQELFSIDFWQVTAEQKEEVNRAILDTGLAPDESQWVVKKPVKESPKSEPEKSPSIPFVADPVDEGKMKIQHLREHAEYYRND